jgi:hypothetical protein
MKNIKSLFGIIIIFISLKTSYGQTNKFDMGVEAGPSIIFQYGNDVLKESHRPMIGFMGGIFFQYNFKKIISLRTNIAFERKGSVFNSPVLDTNGYTIGEATTHSNFDYITLPMLVRASFGKRIQYFINVGPYFGFLIKQTFVTKGDIYPTSTVDKTRYFNRLDMGLTLGVGLIIPIKSTFTFSIEARNNLGLINLLDTFILNNGTVNNNSTNLIVGFAYKFGKRT